MKYFAEVSIANVVISVVTADDNETAENIKKIEKSINTWIETSDELTANRAGVGFTYNPDKNVFYADQPYPSWTLNNTTWKWDPPIPKPVAAELEIWSWNETNKNWENIGYKG